MLAQDQLSPFLTVQPAAAGMHLVGRLPPNADDQYLAQLAEQHQLITPPLSIYHMDRPVWQGLLLGYTALDKPEIAEGVRRLARVLRNQ
jgi:GntR family transcriptional regulator/MocR family aminotransferase